MVSSSSATTTMAPKVQQDDLLCYKFQGQDHAPWDCPQTLCAMCNGQGHTFYECYNKKVMETEKKKEPHKISSSEDGDEMVEHGIIPSTKEASDDDTVPSNGVIFGGERLRRLSMRFSLQPRRRMELRKSSLSLYA